MPSFVDNNNRTWIVRITPYEMREVKDFAGINLGTILQDNMQPLADLLADPVDFSSVMYAICKEQCDKQGVTLKEFMEGFVGNPMEEAVGVFLEALRDCFPTRQRAMLSAALIVVRNQNKSAKKRVDKLLTQLTYTTSPSLWGKLRVWIRSVIPGSSWG